MPEASGVGKDSLKRLPAEELAKDGRKMLTSSAKEEPASTKDKENVVSSGAIDRFEVKKVWCSGHKPQ